MILIYNHLEIIIDACNHDGCCTFCFSESPFKGEKTSMVKKLILELPRENAETLHLLITHLAKYKFFQYC